ncbi:uncharacterized protein LOC126898469 isoform X2 [Daktulosphaira vitifoliae]|nr:uncharacterized protein LOC126898469 isoform X2 [Daktulosphaira vitifoliae]
MASIALGWTSPIIEYVSKGNLPIHMSLSEESWMVTFLDIGNLIMAVPAGILTDKLGRKMSAFITAPIMLIGWLLIFISNEVFYLYIARFLQGCAMAIALIVTPIYIGEIASITLRGSMALIFEISYASGLLTVYTFGWLCSYNLLIILCAIIPIASGIFLYFIPESPYYLMLKGKEEEAVESLKKLRKYSDNELIDELKLIKESSFEIVSTGNFNDLLNRDRWPFIIVSALAILQMGCGASVMEAYASSVLTKTNISANACSVIFGLVILLACIPSSLTIDRYGRRPLYLISYGGTTLCLVATAILLSPGIQSGIPLLLTICGSEFFINLGIMPLLPVVQCEYFPTDTRGLANSIIILILVFTSIVMLKSYQPITDMYGKRLNFIIYAIISFFGYILCYFWLPETKGKSFIEIQSHFENYSFLSNKKHKYYEKI